MNTRRHLHTTLLIVLSCLVLIQPAGAEHAFNPVSAGPTCGDIQPLPENFPDWIEKPGPTTDDCTTANTGATCSNVVSLPDNFPDWIEAPDGADGNCALVEAGMMCDSLGPRTGNSAPRSVLPPDAISEAYDQRNSPECAIADGMTESEAARAPIEGSISAMDQPPGNVTSVMDDASDDEVASESDEPDLLRGRPS